MHTARVVLSCIIGVALSGVASAQVYESKDAQGNTVFSDKPSQGAEEVKLPKSNSADPLVETPRPPPSSETSATPQKRSTKPARSEREETEDDYIYYGNDGDYDVNDDRTRRQERRDEDGVGKPDRERPVHVEPHRNVSRPAARGGSRR